MLLSIIIPCRDEADSILETVNYITEELAKGQKKFMGLGKLHDIHRRIDIMYTTPEEYPFAILYFTGSKEYNQKMREKALTYDYTMNEYGITYVDESDGKLDDKVFVNEKDIFDFLEMDYVKPCER